MKIKTQAILCIFYVQLLFPVAAYAAWYQIEVVVFDNLYSDTDGEFWYQNPGLPDRTDSIELIEILEDENESDDAGNVSTEREENVPYQKLGSDSHRLGGIQRVLKLSREYRPLLHVAWQQPGLNPRMARPVHIQQFEEPLPPGANEEDTEVFDIEAMRAEENVNDEYQVLDLIFDGLVRLRSSRFLHVDVDIAYFPEAMNVDEQDSIDGVDVQQRADYVRLEESRKIKLNEIHYFDHPLFGVILRVSRINLN